MIPKFRAKDEAGTWRIGLLTFMFRQYAIVNESDENTVYLIEKDTIGQSTGLKDKNGVEIFEGDIVVIEYSEYGYRYYEKIVFENGAFTASGMKIGYITKDYCAVCGNIYENPELLEEL